MLDLQPSVLLPYHFAETGSILSVSRHPAGLSFQGKHFVHAKSAAYLAPGMSIGRSTGTQRWHRLQAAGPARLLAELLQQDCGATAVDGSTEVGSQAPLMLRAVVMSCCVGACLSMPPTREPLLQSASSTLGEA